MEQKDGMKNAGMMLRRSRKEEEGKEEKKREADGEMNGTRSPRGHIHTCVGFPPAEDGPSAAFGVEV